MNESVSVRLCTFSADATGQLDVLGHDGDPLGVYGAQIGVFEQADQIGFASLLESHHGGTLETQFGLEILGDFSHQPLERQLSDEKLGALLITTDFSQGHGAWSVSVRFLDTAGSRGALASRLGGQLFPRGLSSGALPCRLLGSCHCVLRAVIVDDADRNTDRAAELDVLSPP